MSSTNKDTINKWVSDKTNGMIKSIDVDQGVDVVFINALYFNDKWKKQFDKSLTNDSRFINNTGNAYKVRMMYKKDDYMYYSNNIFQSIELEYDGSFSMIIILPRKNINPAKLFRKDAELKIIRQQMKVQEVELRIPKFEYESELELSDVLKKMDTRIFSNNYGRLSDNKTFIYKIIQKCKIQLDEHGTKAAAVTAVVTFNSALPSEHENIVFTADHPFLFYIIYRPQYRGRDTATFDILLTGIFNGSS